MAKAKRKAAKKTKTVLRQIRLIVINENGGHEIFEGTEHTARTDAEEYIAKEMWEDGSDADSIDDWTVFEITDYLTVEAENKVKVTIKYENKLT